MKKALLAAAVLAIAGSSFAEEKTFTLKVSQQLELYGALTGGYFYVTNYTLTNKSKDTFNLTNAVLGLKGEVGKGLKVGYDFAFGSLLMPDIWGGTLGDPKRFEFGTSKAIAKEGFGFLWGSLSFAPTDVVTVDVGVLSTNVGYEVANTYSNPNITLGTVWYAQPVIYPGIRINVSPIENVSFYAEYNQEYDLDNFAVGALGEFMGVGFAVSYYDYKAAKNLVDLVLSYSVGIVDLGLNFDYQWLDDSAKTPGKDDTAYGVALYLTPNFENISVPIRLEYFDEGTSGIYSSGGEQGFTFTITPTFKPTGNTFIRAEVAYISTDKKIFKGNTEDNMTTFAVETGFTF
ncbi:MAG: outer membrane beta-barrel protein [Aquificae bacterium]|nr:outer membrane beta-barrel protein [Aquificota bacterium]